MATGAEQLRADTATIPIQPIDVMHSGHAILIGRTIRNMTQAELAQEVGVNRLTIARWEHGERLQGFAFRATVPLIAKTLGVPLEWLLAPRTGFEPVINVFEFGKRKRWTDHSVDTVACAA